MTLCSRISNERVGKENHPDGAPFVHEAAGWHVLTVTAGEEDVLRILKGLFSIHEQGHITDEDLIDELNIVTRRKQGALWQSSFPHSDEGPAAGLLEDIAYCRSLDPRWVEERLTAGEIQDVIAVAGLQATARQLSERFVPIWLQAEAVT
jgi:hypothetical protein